MANYDNILKIQWRNYKRSPFSSIKNRSIEEAFRILGSHRNSMSTAARDIYQAFLNEINENASDSEWYIKAFIIRGLQEMKGIYLESFFYNILTPRLYARFGEQIESLFNSLSSEAFLPHIKYFNIFPDRFYENYFAKEIDDFKKFLQRGNLRGDHLRLSTGGKILLGLVFIAIGWGANKIFRGGTSEG
jgi:hypothetical protein